MVRFIENRNIINVTERKLDITFTGEDASGLRGRIASLFQNLIEINSQIRNQLENGEPKPIIQLNPEHAGESLAGSDTAQLLSSPPPYSFEPAPIVSQPETDKMQLEEKVIAATRDKMVSSRKNWPGRYTLLTNKASLDALATKTSSSETDYSLTE